MKLTDTAIEIAKKVKLLILDVDGVLTDGGIYFDDSGNEFKRFNSLDGHGIKMLLESGIEVGVISARSASAVAHRMKTLGVRHLYQNQANKNEALEQLLEKLSLGIKQVAVFHWHLDRDGVSGSRRSSFCRPSRLPAPRRMFLSWILAINISPFS